MFRFEHIEYLYLLVLIPVLAFVHLWFGIRRKRAIKRIGNPDLLGALMPNASPTRPLVKFYIMLLALVCLIFTLAGPQFGLKEETVKRKGIEIMIALDLSNSMNAQDIKPSRLAQAKLAISQTIDELKGDKVGLVVFAGNAYTQLPITADFQAAKMFLSTISTDMLKTQGTSIGAAINLASNSFSQQEGINKAIIVMSDGENHEDNAVESAKSAAEEKGIRVFTIGMGLGEGAPIPIKPGSSEYIKDKNGDVVVTKLNEQMLVDIAVAGHGKYISAVNIRSGIDALIGELSKIEKGELETKQFTVYDYQFQYMAGIALLLLLIEFIILVRKNKYLKRINLFGSNK